MKNPHHAVAYTAAPYIFAQMIALDLFAADTPAQDRLAALQGRATKMGPPSPRHVAEKVTTFFA